MTAPRYHLNSAPSRWLWGPALAIFIAAAPMLAAVPAWGQSGDVQQLVNTIDRLERQLQALERAVYRGGASASGASGTSPAVGGPPPPAAVSQVQLKTSQLEEQMRGLTGQIEEMGFKISQISDRLDRLVADVDFRLRALEGSGAQTNAGLGAPAPSVRAPSGPPVPPRTAPPTGSVTINPQGAPGPSRVFGTLTESQLKAANAAPAGSGAGAASPSTQQASTGAQDASGLPAGSPEDRYNYARGFLMRRDFAGAEQALQAFVATYPESDLAGNAQYWLGETYYVRNDFGTAARTFAEGFQRYPDSSKAPDNLLKLGMSLAALDRTEDACITLEKLTNEYPKAAANIKKRAETERTRLKCK
jgi:tol-pal system protein YbgF